MQRTLTYLNRLRTIAPLCRTYLKRAICGILSVD